MMMSDLMMSLLIITTTSRDLLICVINGKGETLHAQRDDTEYNNINRARYGESITL